LISPTLTSVDADARPPTMTVCFPGIPHRFVTVRILSDATTRDELKRAAFREFEAFSEGELELLSDVAKPIPGSYGTSTWRPAG